MERLLTFVKIFNVVAGVLLVGGAIALAWLLATRGPSDDEAAAPPDAPSLREVQAAMAGVNLPPGSRLVGIANVQGGLALLVDLPNGDQRLIAVAAGQGATTLLELSPE